MDEGLECKSWTVYSNFTTGKNNAVIGDAMFLFIGRQNVFCMFLVSTFRKS